MITLQEAESRSEPALIKEGSAPKFTWHLGYQNKVRAVTLTAVCHPTSTSGVGVPHHLCGVFHFNMKCLAKLMHFHALAGSEPAYRYWELLRPSAQRDTWLPCAEVTQTVLLPSSSLCKKCSCQPSCSLLVNHVLATNGNQLHGYPWCHSLNASYTMELCWVNIKCCLQGRSSKTTQLCSMLRSLVA